MIHKYFFTRPIPLVVAADTSGVIYKMYYFEKYCSQNQVPYLYGILYIHEPKLLRNVNRFVNL